MKFFKCSPLAWFYEQTFRLSQERSKSLATKINTKSALESQAGACAHYRLVKAGLCTGQGAWPSPSKTMRALRDPRIAPADPEKLRLDMKLCLDVAFARY